MVAAGADVDADRGLIVESRDYHDHLRFAALAGRADRLATACEAELS
jgi:hypothetical protein